MKSVRDDGKLGPLLGKTFIERGIHMDDDDNKGKMLESKSQSAYY